MANDILNSEIFHTQQSDTKSIPTQLVPETKKEGLSLFDNLLKDAKIKVVEGQIQVPPKVSSVQNPLKNVSQTSVESAPASQKDMLSSSKEWQNILAVKDAKNIQQSTENAKNTFDTKLSAKNTIIVPNVEVSKITDKTIVLDKKNDSKIELKSTKNEKIIEIKSEEKSEKKSTISLLDKMIQDLKKEIKPEVAIVPEQKINTRTEQKSTLSLLDKMVQDVKKDSKIEIKSDESSSKNTHNITIKNEKTIDTSHIKVIADAKNEVISQQKNETKQTVPLVLLEDKKQLLKVETKETVGEKDLKVHKETIDTKVGKVSISPSLLDKMVQDIEKNDEKNDEKNEIKKSEVKVIPKNDENLGKVFLDLTTGMQIKDMQKVSNSDTEESQENKILSSLADSLSGKTKIQKKIAEQTKLENLENQKGQFGANMFLSNQKVQGEILSKQKIGEAKEILKEGDKTIKTVKKSAEILDLKPKNIEMITENNGLDLTGKQNVAKVNDLGFHNQQLFLNRAFLNQENGSQIVNNKISQEKIVENKTIIDDVKKTNSDVAITVERTLAEAFTTKVIASKQMMGSFMSDVARNMYINYKPPVTAFKINLDPLNLGNISIVMKNNKSENMMNISLNMSHNSTLETFNDNKTILQNALGKAFNTSEGNFSLDFGMQNQNSNQEFEQQRRDTENKQIIQKVTNSASTLETDERTTDVAKSYM